MSKKPTYAEILRRPVRAPAAIDHEAAKVLAAMIDEAIRPPTPAEETAREFQEIVRLGPDEKPTSIALKR